MYNFWGSLQFILASFLAVGVAAQGNIECWDSCHAAATDWYNNNSRPHSEKIGEANEMFNSCLEETLCS